MTNYVPFVSVGEALPSAEVLAQFSAVPGEEQIYDLPNLHSWLQAGAPDGAGVYADRSARGNNWLQVTPGAQPPILTNWRGTGLNAFNFDGATAYNIAAAFVVPPAEFSAAIVFDINTAAAADSISHTLFGSARAVVNAWVVYAYNRAIYFANTANGRSVSSAALTANAPHLLLLAWSAADQELAISIDGGAWIAVSFAGTGGYDSLADVTGLLGMSNWGSNRKHYGAIAEILLFSGSLKSATEASALALVTAALKAKYAVP